MFWKSRYFIYMKWERGIEMKQFQVLNAEATFSSST